MHEGTAPTVLTGEQPCPPVDASVLAYASSLQSMHSLSAITILRGANTNLVDCSARQSFRGCQGMCILRENTNLETYESLGHLWREMSVLGQVKKVRSQGTLGLAEICVGPCLVE